MSSKPKAKLKAIDRNYIQKLEERKALVQAQFDKFLEEVNKQVVHFNGRLAELNDQIEEERNPAQEESSDVSDSPDAG